MTDDALTDAKPCSCGLDDRPGGVNGPSPTAYSVLMDLCPKHSSKPAEALPWATVDALVQIGYTEPSGYLLDLPPIGVRRGGIRFPRIHMNHTVKRLGWRRWFVQARFDGDETTHRFGPFTSEKKAKVAQGALVQFHRTLDYLHTYKPGSST